jgi:hypothetical protein
VSGGTLLARQERMHPRTTLRIVWLFLALAGCAGTNAGSPPADAASREENDGEAAGISVTIASAVAQGTNLRIEWQSNTPIRNIWYPACGTAPRLLKPDPSEWVPLQDDRPREGTMQPYFLDGVYVENQSLGCDGGNSCYEASWALLTTNEYVQTGTRPPLYPYLPVGSTGPTEAPVPDIVTRGTTAPYALELSYMIGGCPSSQIGTVILPIPLMNMFPRGQLVPPREQVVPCCR